jgi:hypothetical protein
MMERRSRVSAALGGSNSACERGDNDMRRLGLIVVAVVGLTSWPPAVSGGERGYTCRLSHNWWSPKENIGSGLYLDDEFPVPVSERPTVRTAKNWPRVVTGAVEVVYDYGPKGEKPYALRAVIVVSETEDAPWERSVNSAEARAPFDRKWRWLTA